MARKIAVDYLKKYAAKEVLVKLAYSIGLAEPVMVGPITLGRPGLRGPVNRLAPAAAPVPPAHLAPILPWLGR